MNVLLLGNGFDLYYDLPTTYANFLHTVDFICEHYDPAMKTVGSVFGDHRLTDNDDRIRQSYEKYQKEYNQVPLDESIIAELKEKASNNNWFSYFLKNFDKDVGWIDFEKEISKVIDVLSSFFSTDDERGTNGKRAPQTFSQYDPLLWEIMHSFGFDGERKSDARIYGHSYVRKRLREDLYYEDPPESKQRYIDKKKLAQELFASLREFSKCLLIYCRCFVEETVNQLVSLGKISLDQAFQDVSGIVTFNYTNTFEKLCPERKVSHIHGTLDKSIVLGVNSDEYDELSDIDTTFIQFKKYYQRVILRTDIDYLKVLHEFEFVKNETNYQTMLTVMGHSLDITDKDIITELFGLADAIQIFYHSDSALQQYVKNLIAIFGKTEFDRMRYENNLTFIPLSEVGK